MARTKNALPISDQEIEVAMRLRVEERLSWRSIASVLHRPDHQGIRRAVHRRFNVPTFSVVPASNEPVEH